MAQRSTDFCLLAVAVVWGSSYLATKEIAAPDTVFALLVVRFSLAAAVLAAVLCRRLTGLTGPEAASGGVGGILLSAVCVAETYGVTMTSASNAGLIMALTIVATPMIQRHRVAHRFYLAAALAVIGCAMLTQSGGLADPQAGDVVMVIAALLRAVHVTVMARMSAANEIDSARTTLVQLITVSAVALVLCAVSGQSVPATIAAYGVAAWSLTGYLVLVCTVFAFLVQLRALSTTSPARVSLLVGTEPLWAAIIGVTVAGDPITGAGIAGAVLVIIGTTWGRTVLATPDSASLQLRVGVPAGRPAQVAAVISGSRGVRCGSRGVAHRETRRPRAVP
ncbi:DMT family transporter [Mycobacterium sp. DL440]|uniref:DMT family transporter n=1 Tax=Mycobacterium sp. DL440 TaxID=2675523 RepID=UPI00141E1F19|nr:DMT family transporter [Mycobacterium sp. DL440]